MPHLVREVDKSPVIPEATKAVIVVDFPVKSEWVSTLENFRWTYSDRILLDPEINVAVYHLLASKRVEMFTLMYIEDLRDNPILTEMDVYLAIYPPKQELIDKLLSILEEAGRVHE